MSVVKAPVKPHCFGICSAYGQIIAVMSATENEYHDINKQIAKFTASMMGMTQRHIPVQMSLNNMCFSAQALSDVPFFVMLCSAVPSADLVIKTVMAAHVIGSLFKTELSELGEKLTQGSYTNMNNATYHDTVEADDEGTDHLDDLCHDLYFDLFSEHFGEKLLGLDDVACFAYLPLRHALSTRLKPKISSSTDPIISDAGASEAAAIPPCVEDLNYGCYLSVSSDGLVGSDMYVTLGRSVAVADGSGSFSEYSTTDAMNISPFTTLQPFCCTDSMAATIVVNRFLCHLKKTAFECADEFFVLWRKGGMYGGTGGILDQCETTEAGPLNWAAVIYCLPQVHRIAAVFEVPVESLRLEHIAELEDVSPQPDSVLSVDLLGALRASVKRLSFLFPADIKPFSELLTDINGNGISPEAAIQQLDALFEFEAPLPGTVGSIRPSKPPPAKHFKRFRG